MQFKLPAPGIQIALGPNDHAVALARQARHKAKSVGKNPDASGVYVDHGKHLAGPLTLIGQNQGFGLGEHLRLHAADSNQGQQPKCVDSSH